MYIESIICLGAVKRNFSMSDSRVTTTTIHKSAKKQDDALHSGRAVKHHLFEKIHTLKGLIVCFIVPNCTVFYFSATLFCFQSCDLNRIFRVIVSKNVSVLGIKTEMLCYGLVHI